MSGEPRTVSPTRTYVIVLYDIVAENEVRFELVTLPESFENVSTQARYYYNSINEDRATNILACEAYEDFMSNVSGIFKETIFTKPNERVRPKYIPHFDLAKERLSHRDLNFKTQHFVVNSLNSQLLDMKEVRQMLDAWNDEQEHPSTTYTMILCSILGKLQLQGKLMAEIKEVANFIK